MKTKGLLFGVVLCMTLIACNGANKENGNEQDYSYEESREILEDVLEDTPIEVVDYEGDLTPLTIVDDVECEESESFVKFKKGDSDQFVYVSTIETIESPYINPYKAKDGDVVLVDENENEVDFSYVSTDNGISKYSIPVSSFSEDHMYHFKIKNEGLKFKGKNETVREMTYYSLDVNDSNRVHTVVYNNEEIPSYEVSKVQYFDVDAYGAYLVIDEPINLDNGTKFRIANLSKDVDDKDTTYGKLLSCKKNPNGNGYLVRYEPCNGEDIYGNLNINDSITVNQDNIDNLEMFNDSESIENKLAKAFLTHEDVVTAMMGLMNHYHVRPDNYRKSAIDWASQIQVSFNIKFQDSTFTWGCGITLNLNPEENLNVKIILSYKQTTKYDISASVSIDYKWKVIPVGIDYKLEVKEDDTKEVDFKIVLATNLNPYNEKKVKEGIEKDLTDAIFKNTDMKSKFSGESPTGTADGKSYPLIRFDCYYFFPLDIRIEIDFYWKLQLTVETGIKYTSHTTRTDVSISNEKGCDPSSESKAQEDKALDFMFMGNFHAEVGLKVSFGLGISGFYKFFHAEIYITAYGALDAQGFLIMGVSWGSEHEATTFGTIGGKFEISCGVKWGVDVDLLFGGFDMDWPIVTVVLVGFKIDNNVAKFNSVEDTVEITDQDYLKGNSVNLDDYHLLGVQAFNPNNYALNYVDMSYGDTASPRYGAWLDPQDKKYFSAQIIEGSEFITLDNYKISIISIEGIESFDAKIEVTVDDSMTCDGNSEEEVKKIINIHFTNNLKEEIIIVNDGVETSVGTYVRGATVYLPVPEAPRYKRFTGWKNLSTEEFIPYDSTDPETGKYVVPQITEADTVKFEVQFEDYYYWKVVWVDGFGNIVKIDSVFMNSSATPPDPEIRDRYMISSDENYKYEFVKYDKSYDSITENTVIRAIYKLVKVGE